VTGPAEDGIIPACGALVAPIELATGVKRTSWENPTL
jgi:ribonucleotide monophosphatase NagD (HAD superfamily)